MHELILPISVPVTKGGKKFHLNLNQYRNAHYQTLNKAKKAFKEEVEEQIKALPFMPKVAITFVFHPGKGIIPDTANVCCITEKFFCDALVELGKLKDDTRDYVLGTQYLPGERDPSNPRVVARIQVHKE